MSEKISWADCNGVPVPLVPKANPQDGMKKPTLKDAKALNLFYRTTSIYGGMIANEGLERYKRDQLLLAVALNPYRGPIIDPSDPKETPEFLKWEEEVHAEAAVHSSKRAERGSAIHEQVEEWGGDLQIVNGHWESRYRITDHVSKAVAEDIQRFADIVGATDIRFEWNFVSLEYGYTGTSDLYIETPDCIYLCDLKTTGITKLGPQPWESWIVQLSAYDFALCGKADKPIKFVQLVYDQDTGAPWRFHLTPTGRERKGSEDHKVYVNVGSGTDPHTAHIEGWYLYTEAQREVGKYLWTRALEFVKKRNNYDPAVVYAEENA